MAMTVRRNVSLLDKRNTQTVVDSPDLSHHERPVKSSPAVEKRRGAIKYVMCERENSLEQHTHELELQSRHTYS